MDNLIAFIAARLDEDEAIARKAASLQADPENGWGIDGRAITPHIGVIHEDESRIHIARHNPARVLRDVEAKRAILNGRWGGPDHADMWESCVQNLAAVWSDHPDYRAEWKP
jgi:hypothetical protein